MCLIILIVDYASSLFEKNSILRNLRHILKVPKQQNGLLEMFISKLFTNSKKHKSQK